MITPIGIILLLLLACFYTKVALFIGFVWLLVWSLRLVCYETRHKPKPEYRMPVTPIKDLIRTTPPPVYHIANTGPIRPMSVELPSATPSVNLPPVAIAEIAKTSDYVMHPKMAAKVADYKKRKRLAAATEKSHPKTHTKRRTKAPRRTAAKRK